MLSLRPSKLTVFSLLLSCFFLWLMLIPVLSFASNPPDLLEPFSKNHIDEARVIPSLKKSMEIQEHLLILTITFKDGDLPYIPLMVVEGNIHDLLQKEGTLKQWSSLVSSIKNWREITNLLGEKGNFLERHLVFPGRTPKGQEYKLDMFAYHFPKKRVLELGSSTCLLSPKAQRYFFVVAASTYPSSRKVIIIQEPHFAKEEQFALYKGLEVFFQENPQLLGHQGTVFLGEGLTAGQPLSLQPLIQAEPAPSENLVRQILGTFLIPGYVAYEWKYRKGIPILGIENVSFYKISARIWAELQSKGGKNQMRLWPYTVAARNHSMAKTVLSQLDRYDNPILFVGGKHLEPLPPELRPNKNDWTSFGDILNAEELDALRKAETRSVLDYLRDNGVGFYFLSTKGNPLPSKEAIQPLMGQYAALFQSQLQINVSQYIATAPGIISSIDTVFKDPRILRGKTPVDIQEVITKAKDSGWETAPLAQDDPQKKGLMLRERRDGQYTKRVIRWYPPGSHLGRYPYWEVNSPETGTIWIAPEY